MPSSPWLSVLLAVLLTLVPRAGQAKSVFPDCTSHAKGTATVVFPSSISQAVGPANDKLAGGSTPDSVAVLSSSGDCVGVAAWDDSSATALSVAGKDTFFHQGLAQGDSLHFRIYDASRGTIDRALVRYRRCSSVDSSLNALCRADGKYQENAVYVVEAFGSESRTLRVRGTQGEDGKDAGWRFVGVPTNAPIQATQLRLGTEPVNFNLPQKDMLLEWVDDRPTSSGPSGAYEELTSTDLLRPGRGYAIYLFDTPPYSINPHMTIHVVGGQYMETAEPVRVDGLSQTAQWHLLANPYPSGYALSGLSDLASHGFQTTLQRYDAGAGTWVLENQPRAEISAWEAFFIERSDFSGGQGASALTFGPQGRIIEAPFCCSNTQDGRSDLRAALGLTVRAVGPDGRVLARDEASRIVFDDRATPGWDPYDASKLSPLDSEYVLLPLLGTGRDGTQTAKAVESRSWPSGDASIPLQFRMQGLDPASVTISVRQWSLPSTWHVRLVDTHTGTSKLLDSDAAYTFSADSLSSRDSPRFELEILPDGAELPIELSSFTARLNDTSVHLKWHVQSRKDTEPGFYIDRRSVEDTTREADPDSWAEIGYVSGESRGSEDLTFRFTDGNLPYTGSRFIYRLRQVDAHGDRSFSREVGVERPTVEHATLRAPFPNPAHGHATIRYELPRTQKIELTVYDVLGRRVMQLASGERSAGRHQLSLNAARLSSGVYYCRLYTQGGTRTQRIVVRH